MIVDRFVNIACQAANLATNSSKSGFQDIKSAVAAVSSSGTTGTQPVVIVNSASNGSSPSTTQIIIDIVVFIILLVIILVVGLWLWNNLAAKYITIFKPLPSVWHLLGLIVIIDLIHPGCMCGVTTTSSS